MSSLVALPTFAREGAHHWIVRTAWDNYFVVDHATKGVIELIMSHQDVELAWHAYSLIQAPAPRLSRAGFEAVYAALLDEGRDRENSLLAIRAKLRILSSSTVARLCVHALHLSPRASYAPVMIALAMVAVTAIMVASQGMVTKPAGVAPILSTFALVVLGVMVHEIGHATALLKAGQQPSGIWFGIRYLVYPCFFTDVSPAWLLDKRSRLLVNSGGVYFQSLYGLVLLVACLASPVQLVDLFRYAFLMSAMLIFLQLIPFSRSDGHWIIRDLGSLHLRRSSVASRLLGAIAITLLCWLGYLAIKAAAQLLTAVWSLITTGRIPPELFSLNTVYAAVLVIAFCKSVPALLGGLHRYAARLCGMNLRGTN